MYQQDLCMLEFDLQVGKAHRWKQGLLNKLPEFGNSRNQRDRPVNLCQMCASVNQPSLVQQTPFAELLSLMHAHLCRKERRCWYICEELLVLFTNSDFVHQLSRNLLNKIKAYRSCHTGNTAAPKYQQPDQFFSVRTGS